MSEVMWTIVAFLQEIGIEVRHAAVRNNRLPGMNIANGALVFNPELVEHPGDLLHEAGHVAFTPAAARSTLSHETLLDAGDEMAAIAWSYAAAQHLGLAPAIVFHGHGYRGSSSALIENFAAGRYVGVSLLAWAGMTLEPQHRTAVEGVYPRMTRWLRD